MTDVLVHTAEGVLEPYRFPSRLERIELEDADAILRLYEKTLERVGIRRLEYERTLLLFFKRLKKHSLDAWKLPYLSVNHTYWRAVVWHPYVRAEHPRLILKKWYCKADGGRWITDTGYPRRGRRLGHV